MLTHIKQKKLLRNFYRYAISRMTYLLFLLSNYFVLNIKNITLDVKLASYSASFYISSLNEFVRVKSFSGEKNVITFLLDEISLGDTVMDIGANIGTHSILFSKKTSSEGKVFSIEPNNLSASRLRDNIDLNKLNNIDVFEVGFGEKNKEEILSIASDPSYGKSRILKDFIGKPLTQKIHIVNGDEFIRDNKLEIPNVIKIDVEGYENEVIKGLSNTLNNPKCRVVMCEFNFLGDEDLFEKKGFEVIYSSKRGLDTHRIYRKFNSK